VVVTGAMESKVKKIDNAMAKCQTAEADYKDFITRANLKWLALIYAVLSEWSCYDHSAVRVPDEPAIGGWTWLMPGGKHQLKF